jgi:general secretion pathway protein N
LSSSWRWAALVLGFALGGVLFAPATLLSQGFSRATQGVVELAGASGTLWNGSAQVQLHPERLNGDRDAKPQPPLVLPGRLAWQMGWSFTQGLWLQLQSPQLSGPLAQQPIRVQAWWTSQPQLSVPDGALRLPHLNLRHATGPLALFRPDFQPSLAWSGLQSTRLQDFRVTLTLDDLGSAISPIRPLGSYRVALAPEAAGARAWSWRLESIGSPVIALSGEGRIDQMLRGRLRLQCMRNCEFVGGILSAVGKKNGEIYEAQFGL